LNIYLDMDGVCCDFVGAVCRLFGKPELIDNYPWDQWDIAGILDITEEELWTKVSNRGMEWWADMDAYPWFWSLYQGLDDLSPVTFLSSPTHDPQSLAGKLRWIQSRLGYRCTNYILTPRKNKALLARPGDILIDDSPKSIDDWNAAGGIGWLWRQRWNTEPALECLLDSEERLSHCLKRIGEIKENCNER